MKRPMKNGNDLAMSKTTDQGSNDQADGGAMSPSMRQLILSFGEADSERIWDPDAYNRRPLPRQLLVPRT